MFEVLFFTKEKKNFKWAILLSILIHIIFLAKSVNKQSPLVNIEKANKTRKIKLTFKNRSKKMQIVNSNNLNKTKPVDSKYLSKNNQKVDREVVAKTIGKHKDAGRGIKRGQDVVKTPTKKQPREKKSLSKVKKKRIVKNYRKILNNKKKKKISLADLSFSKNIPLIKEVKQKVLKGLKNGHESKRGLASNNDFIEDIPLGDATKLNTIEFKYYGFYFRIRQKLEQYWGNNLRNKASQLFKSGRHIASDINHITSLKITLDNQGNIIDIFIKGTSGLTELDEAAVDSFNKAGPFPNPPKGMLSDGKAHIEWGFVVKS